jgi:hypothetical protein
VGIDLTGLDALTAGIARTQAAIAADAAAIVKRGAQNIKTGWQANARASAPAHAPAYPASISYDITTAGGVIEAEIGPDKERRQGALGNLLEYGSAHNPPHNDGGIALADEEPRFQAQVQALADRVMRA